MDENDALSEYNMIPLGHNRTNGVVYSKIDFKVEICSAHYDYSLKINLKNCFNLPQSGYIFCHVVIMLFFVILESC